MATCDVQHIDSNVSGLRYAIEECPGELPPAPVWKVLEPNSYADFGATTEQVVREFISEGRQRKKGVTVGVDASAGFNQDLTQTNAQELLSAFMFADIREKTSYMVENVIDGLAVEKVDGQFATLVSADLDFTTLGLIPGEWIFIGGDLTAERFDAEGNNGFKRIRSITADTLVIDKSDMPMVAEDGVGKTIILYLGRVLKNEAQRALIKKKTIQLERTLGSLDELDPPQSEYIIGAHASEATFNLAQRDKITVDFSFMAIDHEVRNQVEGLKPGTRPDMPETDAFNTTDHVRRIRMALADGTAEAPEELFGYVSDFSLTINNTLSSLTRIGQDTAFGVTAGTFAVDASVEAFFTSVEAVRAVRENRDVTVDMILVRENAGIVFDMPLTSLSGGQAGLTLNEPIMLPLDSGAASGSKISPDLNHTLLLMFFDVLPNWAE